MDEQTKRLLAGLQEQRELLMAQSRESKDPEQVRRNVETVLKVTIALLEWSRVEIWQNSSPPVGL